jgi:outer membrane lipoprotein LolB
VRRCGFTGAASALLSLFFAACASAPPAADLGPVLAGRLVVRVAATPERAALSQSAAFEWRGNGERGELRLFTPLGTQMALASWAAGNVRLRTSEGEARFASLEELSRQVLGEALPLAAWSDWLAGRPWPGAAHEPLSPGTGAGFAQLGWEVDLSRHIEGRIGARRIAAPAVSVLIVLTPA